MHECQEKVLSLDNLMWSRFNMGSSSSQSSVSLITRALSVFVAIVLALGLMPLTPYSSKAEAAPDNLPVSVALQTADSAIENELIVVYKDEAVSLDEKLSIDASEVDPALQRKMPDADSATLSEFGVVGQQELEASVADNQETVLLTLEDGVDPQELAEQLQASDEIVVAQPNFSYGIMSVNDPYVAAGKGQKNQYYLQADNVPAVWDYAKSEDKVSIAVLDTGINMDHPDLRNVIDRSHAYDAVEQIELTGNSDTLGHGTLVAGVLAAEANNGIGIAGVSYNASLIPIKVFNKEGRCTTADLLSAYAYLDKLISESKISNLKVINLSLGYYGSGEEESDIALQQAIKNMRNQHGVLTVGAGGNGDEAGNPRTASCYPADFDECLSVTALTQEGKEASWSDRNQSKDISAPGEAILSTDTSGDYSSLTGTSMAAPQVSAAAALLWSAKPDLSVSQVENALKQNARSIEEKTANNGSAGALDIAASLHAICPEFSFGAMDDGENGSADDSKVADDDSSKADQSASTSGDEAANGTTIIDGSQYVIGDKKAEEQEDDSSTASEGNQEALAWDSSEGDDSANSWRYVDGKKITVLPEATTEKQYDSGISVLGAMPGVASYATWFKRNGHTTYSWRANPSDKTTDIAIPNTKRVGIDVSSWQGTIDWKKVKADGISFAIIRCGSYKSSNKEHQIDSKFVENVKNARANGIAVGVYIYSYAQNVTGTNSAQKEAQNTLAFLKKAGLTSANMSLPVYYDLEDSSQAGFSAQKLGQMAKMFCDTVAAEGYSVGIYANQNWWRNHLTDSVFNASNWSRWAARYPGGNKANSSGVDRTDIWQFTDCGQVNGISGNVDMNVDYAGVYTSRSMAVQAGEYMIASSLNRKSVLDVAGSSTANSANVALYQAQGQLNQRFSLTYDSSSGYYTITNAYSGKVLDVTSANASNGANVQQYQSNNTLAQRWIIRKNSNGTFKIASALNPDYVLDIKEGKSANGTNIQLYQDNGTAAQQFTFSNTMPAGTTVSKTVDDGLYTLSSSLSQNAVLDVSGGSGDSGANIQLYTSNKSAAQHFRAVRDNSTGYYTLINEKSGKVLDVSGGKCSNGRNIQQYNSNNTLAQRWIISKESNGTYRISSALNLSFVLDAKSGKASNGTNIQIYQTNSSAAQKFKFNKQNPYPKTVTPGVYTITSDLSSNKVLDVRSGSKNNSANIQLYNRNGTAAQSFRFQYEAETGYYIITNTNSGKVIDLSGGKVSNGRNIQQYQSNNTLAQRWIVERNGNGSYRIKSALHPDYVVDISGGRTSNGANVQLYIANGTKAQNFYIR